MSYDLSFTEAFFTGENEPEITDYPTSVLEAIYNLRREEKLAIAREVLNVIPSHVEFMVDSEMFESEVLEKVRDTNTCRDLQSPVEVYIDSDGYHTLRVWDFSNYEIVSYDVWGNSEDGYNVNQAFYTGTIVKLTEDHTDAQIVEALIIAGYCTQEARGKLKLDNNIDNSHDIYLIEVEDGKPFCELRRKD